MPTDPSTPTPGRSLVSRRAIVDVVRSATLGSYGVIGFAGGGWFGGIAERLGLAPRGIQVQLVGGRLAIDLDLLVAHGLPIAEVARQVDSAVRYGIRRALDRELDRLTIHVDGLRIAPYDVRRPGAGRQRDALEVAPDDLAASGTDVA
ncbi:MAG TPA: Asp23/Gls24 family envelope stress response protein [Candidatus Limnocylindrales bacterium]|nr:Asp23/Gls24 family envelope stress response protein [Candidatus Limnocylindrales bacterium]